VASGRWQSGAYGASRHYQEIQAVIAAELGHLKCEHGLSHLANLLMAINFVCLGVI
jgi:Zn-dependent protease with chaperone function